MEPLKENVVVEMRSVIEEQGEEEVTVTKHKGNYIKKKQIEVIRFTERTKDLGDIKHFITIYPNKVNLKKSGSVSMNQQFVTGKTSECLYRHPYGAFRIEIHTKSVTKKYKDQTTEIHIVYDSEMNEDRKRHHHLTLTYTEEE